MGRFIHMACETDERHRRLSNAQTAIFMTTDAQYWLPTVLHAWAAWVRREKHISMCDIWDATHLANTWATDEQMVAVDKAVHELPVEFRDAIKQRYLDHTCVDDFSDTMQTAIDLLSRKIGYIA